jgi:hypothetical protein
MQSTDRRSSASRRAHVQGECGTHLARIGRHNRSKGTLLRVRLRGVREELLQTFRLSHALAEAGIPLAVRRRQAEGFRWLDQYFPGLDWKVTRFARAFSGVTVDHQTPRTSVGSIDRPLIFAHAIADLCSDKWSDRAITISLAGTMTDSRRVTLRAITHAFGEDFQVVETDAGRAWPGKAWDDDYYTVLGRSALTACPDGDFVWTYRFFEGALCGSIPVVESFCDHYEGFRYYRMTDVPASMKWRRDWAEHNFVVARERLTVSHDELRQAVGS